MSHMITHAIASVTPVCSKVPDSGFTSLLLGSALISILAISRYLKKRAK